jgi:hypothetical protein
MRFLAAFAAAIALLSAADSKLGKPLALKQPIATLLAKPASYVATLAGAGHREDIITAVCQEMGCWMYLADDPGRAAKKRRLDPRRGARG